MTQRIRFVASRRFFKNLPLYLISAFLLLFGPISAGTVRAEVPERPVLDPRDAVQYTVMNGIRVLRVDLTHSEIRVQTLQANNSGGTETVQSMAARSGAIAAINADYFSYFDQVGTEWPEGLMYVNGNDLTRCRSGFNCADLRSSIAFSSSDRPHIGRGRGGRELFNVAAGGPQFMYDGQFRFNLQVQGTCPGSGQVVINEDVLGCSAANWHTVSTALSAVGISPDGNTLFLAASEGNVTMQQMHDVLWQQGARNALRLDGGGSRTLYFNGHGGAWTLGGGRPVANAIAILPDNSPPPPCNPNSDQVSFFVDANYSGQCVTKGAGEYSNPGAIGLPNDSISSIRVGSNARVRLCRDDNFQGTCEDFQGDDSNLGDNSIGDNQVSSARVETGTTGCSPNADQVALFVDPNYGGQCVVRGIGDYSNPGAIGLPNDAISSIRVGSSVRAQLCHHDNYDGTCEYFLGDDDNLSNNAVGDNQVSSARVEVRPVDCPTITAWRGEYWNNPDLSGQRALCRDDAQVVFDWAYGSPHPSIAADGFSVRWTRTLTFSAGWYRFYVSHDDGARLFINDVEHLNQWNTCCATHSVDVFLPAGNHTLRLEMYEGGGAASVNFWWQRLPGLARLRDHDLDNRSELVVWRPSNGYWYWRTSSSGFNATAQRQWGRSDDVPLAGDIDGDGKSDLIIWRPSNGYWYWRTSSSGYDSTAQRQWGRNGDVPLVGDLDGDGKSDLAIWRPHSGYWFWLTSSSGYAASAQRQWGRAGDVPLVGDIDGDNRSELVIWRPSSGYWYWRTSSSGYNSTAQRQWGKPGDVPLLGDTDGDDRSDLIIWRPFNGYWHWLASSSGYGIPSQRQWGRNGDIPLVGDMDGDGRSDLTIWRPSNGYWYWLTSSSGYAVSAQRQWGRWGDLIVDTRRR